MNTDGNNEFMKASLFEGIEEKDIPSMLSCLSARKKSFKKGAFIFFSGEKIEVVGLVLCGSVHIIKEDFWGNRTMIGEAGPGQLFGEVYACLAAEELGVSIISAEDTEILFLDVKKIVGVCTSSCCFHTRLIRNLLSIIAQKNLALTRKMEHMSKKTTREKLLSYLSFQSMTNNSSSFEIPFNRQQLAEYLAVDRSAMSKELCRLRDEGMLTFRKNKFHLKEEIHR